MEEMLHRGIECRALVDPWNILGFQGLFPLAAAKEDSIRDPHIGELIDLLDAIFQAQCRLVGEMAAAGQAKAARPVLAALRRLAEWWDRFAAVEVSEVRRLHGGEVVASAEHLAATLARWHERGETAADLAFWRQHLEGFQTPKAFAQVVEALFRKQDFQAAMGLLMNWLNQAEQVPLDEEPFAFDALAIRWMSNLSQSPDKQDSAWPLAVRFLDHLEANAEDYWQAPTLFPDQDSMPEREAPESSEGLFEAAYEGVTFQDSADDDQEGDVLEGAPGAELFDLEVEAERIGERLRLLSTVGRLWKLAAGLAPDSETIGSTHRDTLAHWLATAQCAPSPARAVAGRDSSTPGTGAHRLLRLPGGI